MPTESKSKVYGLSFPTKKPKDETLKRIETVFNTDSDDDDGAAQLTKSDFEKALEEDPSIFEYDEIYEDICNNKMENAATTIDKACQKKSKLNDLDELVKKRKEEGTREDYMDITKQEGLGGFYRYMYQHGTKSDPPEPTDSLPVGEIKKEGSLCKTTDQGHYGKTSSVVDDGSSETANTSKDKLQNVSNDHDSTRRSSHDRSSDRHSHNSSSKKSTGSSVGQNRTCSNNPDVKMISARQRVTSDEQLKEARERYLTRKAEGIHPRIVTSDSE